MSKLPFIFLASQIIHNHSYAKESITNNFNNSGHVINVHFLQPVNIHAPHGTHTVDSLFKETLPIEIDVISEQSSMPTVSASDIQNHSDRRWVATTLFAAYWDYHQTLALIEATNKVAAAFTTDFFYDLEKSLGTEELSTISQNLLIDVVFTKMQSRTAMIKGESDDSSVEIEAPANSCDEDLCQNFCQMPIPSQTSELLSEAVSFYHTALFQITNITGDHSQHQTLFDALEQEFLSTIIGSLSSLIESEEPKSLEFIQNQILKALNQGKELLIEKNQSYWQPISTLAAAVARAANKSPDNLDFLDFYTWALSQED